MSEREVKGAQSKPNPSLMLSPNYWMRACKKRRGLARSLFERKILGNYEWELSVDYQWELSLRFMRERWKGRRVNPTLRLMPSPNYGTRACKKERGTRTVHSLRGKSSGIIRGLSSENYQWELSVGIIVWELWPSISSRRKVEIYRDTGVSKKIFCVIWPLCI